MLLMIVEFCVWLAVQAFYLAFAILAAAILAGLACLQLLAVKFVICKLTSLVSWLGADPLVPQVCMDGNFGGDEQEDNIEIRQFTISVPGEELEDLKDRLRRTRYAPRLTPDVGFSYGFPSAELQKWVKYCAEDYDWKRIEASLNRLPHYKTQIEGLDIHFIHTKPPTSQDGPHPPLLMVHGWPGSFVEFLKVIPLLMESTEGLNFELIIPSLPGYGFSQAPSRPGFNFTSAARIFKKLMADRLGHEKFFIHGTDLGAAIGRFMAVLYPEHVRGLHTTLPLLDVDMRFTFWIKLAVGKLLPWLVFNKPQEDLAKVKPLWDGLFQKITEKRGYAALQATKPDTMSAGLTDSPAGLAAYILEKFTTWTYRTERDLAKLSPAELTSRGLTRDDILTNVMIYWISGHVTPSMRFFKENFRLHTSDRQLAALPVRVPTGYADFPGAPQRIPRSLLTRTYQKLIHYTTLPAGGHFAAFEEPELLARDVRQFVSKVLKDEHHQPATLDVL